MPRVSVIMPSYQKGRFIAEAIDSVLAQTFRDYELVVVDSSTDETPQILAGYADRVRVLRVEPRGISPARNAGIRASTGELVAFLDADDTWAPDKLEKQVARIDRDAGVGLVCSDVLFRDERGLRPGRAFADAPPRAGHIHPIIFARSFIGTLTVLVRRQCLERAGLFDETITACEDHDLWLKISREWAIDFVDEPLAVYRYSAGQASADRERTLAGMPGRPNSGLIRVQERAYEASAEIRGLDRASLDAGFFNLYLELAGILLASGRTAVAADTLARYRSVRGLSRRYLKLRVASSLPPWILRSLHAA